MNKQLHYIIQDLRRVTILPRRYDTPKGKDDAYWRERNREYADYEKVLRASDLRWRVITYDDGHEELAYLRVLQGGVFSGLYPAIYRGVILPRRIELGTWARIKDIRIAF